jgi:PiT family inorganic phosphate transporter
VIHGGWKILILAGFKKTILFIFLSPILGMVLGYIFMTLVFIIFRRFTPTAVDGIFRIGQFFSAAAYSIGHGANDSQKTMGIIVALLLAVNRPEWAYRGGGQEIAWWIIICCYAAMAFGTMSGGWRIVKTMGQKITKLRPVGGFCAELGGAISLFWAASLGVPVSTTHTITGAIIGVGSTTKFSSVKWGVAGKIVWAWILTIPASALIAGIFEWVFGRVGLQ